MSDTVPIRTRRAVSKDISPSLILEMRKQGMTNKEIANQTGTCYATVLSYIGKQGFKGEGKRKRREAPPPGDAHQVRQAI